MFATVAGCNVLLRRTRVLSVYTYRTMAAAQSFTNKKGEESTLRHVKYQLNKKGKISPPGFIEAQVVGTGSPGTPRALMLNMAHFKYLFNCGEGTQRIGMEHKMRISKVQEIFITKYSWENIGGLLGMSLSLESMQVPSIRLHGPPHVEKLVTLSKGFAQLHKLRVEKFEAADCGSYSDSAMHVDYITLLPRDPDTEPARKRQKTESIVVAYLLQPHPVPRSVCLEKCVDLGIKTGPIIGQLKNGKQVTLEDGRTINPDDILLDPEPNPPFLVLECPSPEYIPSLTTNARILTAAPGFIVHMTPHDVWTDPEYQAWVRAFSESTTHLLLNERCSGLVYEGVYRIQTMLGMIHPGMFPTLPEAPRPTSDEIEVMITSPNVVLGETNLKYNIRKKLRGTISREQCITLDPELVRETALSNETLVETLKSTKTNIAANTNPDAAQYPELLFLGTGSSIPNKVRNVSAILLNLSSDQSVLLDCGENTLGQLMRHYGNQTNAVLKKLAVIFVSHLHADHHLGIVSIVQERQRILRAEGSPVTPLTVVAPHPLIDWYRNMDTLDFDIFSAVRVIPVRHFYENQRSEDNLSPAYSEIIDKLNMKQVDMVEVYHRQHPHGVVMTHKDGWKLVYSGDTMPCQNLVRAGMDCDVLIHEATMEDDLEKEAAMKKHSTTSQAIQIGLDMKAKFILLTHFSQRYAKVPLFNDNFSSRVGIAFDNMKVSLSELPLIPHLLPALKELFAEDYSEMEERTLKRSFKKAATEDGGAENGAETDKISTAVKNSKPVKLSITDKERAELS